MYEGDINNYDQLMDAWYVAKNVYIQGKFGTSEVWIRITKKEAYRMIDTVFSADGRETPFDLEMDSGTFGTFDINRDLYLGM